MDNIEPYISKYKKYDLKIKFHRNTPNKITYITKINSPISTILDNISLLLATPSILVGIYFTYIFPLNEISKGVSSFSGMINTLSNIPNIFSYIIYFSFVLYSISFLFILIKTHNWLDGFFKNDFIDITINKKHYSINLNILSCYNLNLLNELNAITYGELSLLILRLEYTIDRSNKVNNTSKFSTILLGLISTLSFLTVFFNAKNIAYSYSILCIFIIILILILYIIFLILDIFNTHKNNGLRNLIYHLKSISALHDSI